MDCLSMIMLQLLLSTFLGFVVHALPLHDHQQYSLPLFSDQTALMAFKKDISSDARQILENWKETTRVCNWNGVSCDPNGTRVIHLILAGSNLHGTLSPYLSNLTCLRKLDLSENSFHGPIPSELGDLANLDEFSLRGNEMEDEIPENFGRLTRLRYIDLSSNQLQGRLPTSLFSNCSQLQYIDLSNNSFTGVIPSQIGNSLPLLQTLNLYMNQLNGYFPPSLSNASALVDLDLELNYLTGPLPSLPVRHMFLLETLHLSDNDFSSDYSNTNLAPFFTSIANLTHLRELELAANNLGGELPLVIGRLINTNLSELLLQDNLIHGAIPQSIANLSSLTLLNLSNNRLSGTIPPELSLLPKLERLCLSNNSLTEAIPAALGALSHLGLLDLSMNKLTGPIPSSLAKLTQLRKLILHNNLLSGTIPSSLGRSVNLEILDLAHNRLTGSIPANVAGLGDITIYFNVSNNALGGPLPEEFSKMDKVQAIDLSFNNLSGRIPSSLGNCLAVQVINLSHNTLTGTIPGSLANLLSIQSLDLSHNRLTGEIPAALQNCNTLTELDFSFNNLSGLVPKGGPFSFFTLDSFEGNQGLCGFHGKLSNCQYRTEKRHGRYSSKFLAILASIVSGTVFFLTICSVVSTRRIRKYGIGKNAGARTKTIPLLQSGHPRITYRELAEATGGFHESRLVGSGSFGRVYRGVFSDETVVAVKVLQLQGGINSTKSFNRECQILKQIRHRNLMRIVTACSLPDFKALVLPFMANGSLEDHLYHGDHTGSSSLSLTERVRICSDIAEGMAYLHHHSPVQVIHCDLKPSNIMLNDDMTALVSDFGIARLVMNTVDREGGTVNPEYTRNSTANLVCGSVGYIAPEYGLGRGPSTKGDVYSFGVLVLEMVTGKRPTDEFFNGGLSLIRWAKTRYRGRFEKVIDSSLLSASWDQSTEVRSMWEVALVELIELGLLCTQEAPSSRPTMVDAADDLGRLKQYLSGDTTATFASSLGMSSSTVLYDRPV